MSSISMLGMTISSVASSLFEELYNNQKLWSKLKNHMLVIQSAKLRILQIS